MTTQTIAPQIIGDEELQAVSGGMFPVIAGLTFGGITAGAVASIADGKKVPPFSTLEMIIPYYASMAAAKAVGSSSN